MTTMLKKSDKAVDAVVGKPVSWDVYDVLLPARCCLRDVVRCGNWLKSRHAAATVKSREPD